MLSIIDGIIKDSRIKISLIAHITHGPLKHIDAILMHQTASPSGSSAMNSWKVNKDGAGAHILIDKDGTTYQTVPLNRKCYHIAPIRSRCYVERRCVPVEAGYFKFLDLLNHTHHVTQKQYNMMTDHHERAMKEYPERYAGNEDSIGIEVVGMPLGTKDDSPWEKPTDAQNKVTHWLVPALLAALDLKQTDVFRHGVIGFKKMNEAKDVTW